MELIEILAERCVKERIDELLAAGEKFVIVCLACDEKITSDEIKKLIK